MFVVEPCGRAPTREGGKGSGCGWSERSGGRQGPHHELSIRSDREPLGDPPDVGRQVAPLWGRNIPRVAGL